MKRFSKTVWLGRWQHFRDLMQGGVRQQVTLFGVIFSFAIMLVGLAAFASGNNLVFLILAVMLSAMLVSGFISRLSLAALRLEFFLPDHIAARRSVDARIVVSNEKWLMPAFSIHLARVQGRNHTQSIVYAPVIPSRSTVDAPLQLWFPKRGTQQSNQFLFSTRFPFGFTERRIEVDVKHDILIYPCLDPQPGFEELLAGLEGEIETHFRGRGDDFYRIRPYELQESARFIDWKASAHTGAPQVREFARNEDREVDLMLDLNVPLGLDPWFEHVIDCTAFLAWRLWLDGIHLRLRTQNADLQVPAETDVYAILRYLALVEPAAGRLPEISHDPRRFQIVLSAQPAHFAYATGDSFAGIRVLGPEQLPAGSAAATTAARA